MDDISTVLPREVEELRIIEGKDYCTLVTCTPYGINTHRLLVRGHRVALPDNTELPTTQEKIQGLDWKIKLLAVILAPSLLSIPEESPETGGWDYTVTMQPKNTVTPVQPDKKPTVPTKKPDKNLPDTGVLQWPIPVLAGAGVACMLLGWRMKRKKF